MPIYEYQCMACGHRLEALQKLSDEPLSVCPVCDKSELRKLISAAAFRLKGSGWYETDFKSSDKKNIAESTDKPSKDDSSKTASEGKGCGGKACGCKSDTG